MTMDDLQAHALLGLPNLVAHLLNRPLHRRIRRVVLPVGVEEGQLLVETLLIRQRLQVVEDRVVDPIQDVRRARFVRLLRLERPVKRRIVPRCDEVSCRQRVLRVFDVARTARRRSRRRDGLRRHEGSHGILFRRRRRRHGFRPFSASRRRWSGLGLR